MELKLRVRRGGATEKEYTADTCELSFGAVEDLISCIDVDAIADAGSDAEVMAAVGKAAVGSMDVIKPVLKDTFPGITDEELRRVPLKDVAAAVVGIATYSVSEIMELAGGDAKNPKAPALVKMA